MLTPVARPASPWSKLCTGISFNLSPVTRAAEPVNSSLDCVPYPTTISSFNCLVLLASLILIADWLPTATSCAT
ncbi:hypothetical protein D3C86_2032970 [compost metagenome]